MQSFGRCASDVECIGPVISSQVAHLGYKCVLCHGCGRDHVEDENRRAFMSFRPWTGTSQDPNSSALMAVFFVDQNHNLVFFNGERAGGNDRVVVTVPGLPDKRPPIATNAFMLSVSMRRPEGVDEDASCGVEIRSERIPHTSMAILRLSLDRDQMRSFCDAFWKNIPTLQENTLRDKTVVQAPADPPPDDDDDDIIATCVEWKPLRDPFMFCHLSDVAKTLKEGGLDAGVDQKMSRPILFTCCNSLHNPYAFFRSVVTSRIQSGAMPFTCPKCKAFEAFPERIIKQLAQSHVDRLRGKESYRIVDKQFLVK